MPGDINTSVSQQDQSSLSSGNGGGDYSADRISKQFINAGNSNNLDLNSYLNNANAGFYASIRGEQQLELGLSELKSPAKQGDNKFKYAALGAGVLVVIFLAISFKGKSG